MVRLVIWDAIVPLWRHYNLPCVYYVAGRRRTPVTMHAVLIAIDWSEFAEKAFDCKWSL